jgi:hypothetical protein
MRADANAPIRALRDVHTRFPHDGGRRINRCPYQLRHHDVSMDDQDKTPPPCPVCGSAMSFISAIPKVASLPELRTYRCHPCGIVSTKELSGSGTKYRGREF